MTITTITANPDTTDPQDAMPGVAIIGGGPAGLMAAETIARAGHAVTLYDAMPSLGRKLLMAGKSGLNLTHAEDIARFLPRFGPAQARLEPALRAFDSTAIRQWAEGLGAETFVGSSGRVFPRAMKASPLLRAWLVRLAAYGVTTHVRHRWQGFAGDALLFETPQGLVRRRHDAVVLALGGASWPRLGSDAGWVGILSDLGVTIAPFKPANCGFDVAWSPVIAERFAGQPIKSVTATSSAGTTSGEFVLTRNGVEGSLIYAHAAALRDDVAAHGAAALILDLLPDRNQDAVEEALRRQPSKASFSTRLRKATGLDGVKAALARELTTEDQRSAPARFAHAIKALPLPILRPRPIAEVISSAGGVSWDDIGPDYQLRKHAGVFVAGEMLDWEAPTGGYLLSACLATGRAAGEGVIAHLSANQR